MEFIVSTPRAKSLTLFATLLLFCLTLASTSLRAAPREDVPYSEFVQVFAADCLTAKTTFYLGDTVCARVGEFPAPPASAEYYRRINWSAPNLLVAETQAIKADPQYDKFTIPSSGDFALPGVWRVQTVDIETGARAYATFNVRSPLSRFADLRVWKQGPVYVLPGDPVMFQLSFRNDGPDTSDYVQFTESVPANATFRALKQTSGPLFDCKTPAAGELGGTITCLTKGLRPGEQASFDVYYAVSDSIREGEPFATAAQVTTRTEELHKEDNEWQYATLIAGISKEDGYFFQETANADGYVGDPVRYPKPESVNPDGYVGDKYDPPAPEPVNPKDYKGDDYIPPDPEP